MGLFVTEFAGYQSGRPQAETPTAPPIRTSVMSSGSSAAATLLQFTSGTRMVRFAADVAFYLTFASSTGATGSQSSTNSERVAAGAPAEFRFVNPYGKLIAFST